MDVDNQSILCVVFSNIFKYQSTVEIAYCDDVTLLGNGKVSQFKNSLEYSWKNGGMLKLSQYLVFTVFSIVIQLIAAVSIPGRGIRG